MNDREKQELFYLEIYDEDCEDWNDLNDGRFPATPHRYQAEDDLREARQLGSGRLRVASCVRGSGR